MIIALRPIYFNFQSFFYATRESAKMSFWILHVSCVTLIYNDS